MNGGSDSSGFFDDFLFPKIFQSFRMAIQPSKIIITFSALTCICLTGWLMDLSQTVAVSRDIDGEIIKTELNIYMDANDLDEAQANLELLKVEGQTSGVFSIMWLNAAEKFQGAVDSVFDFDIPGLVEEIKDFILSIGWFFRFHPVYFVIFSAITLVVFSVAAGAVCRIAALQIARGEKTGLTKAMRFSLKRFSSLVVAPLTPFAIMVFIGISILLLGLIGNIPWAGELIVGLFIPLAFLAASLIAVVVIGTAAGSNLMFASIAYDGSDCFDAISRSYSYVYARPWRMLFYTTLTIVYGAICYTFVWFFASLSLWITHWALQLGIWTKNGSGQINKLDAIWTKPEFKFNDIWPSPEFMNIISSSSDQAANWTELISAFLIYLFSLAVVGLIVSFIINFYLSANTIIYSLLRHKVDGTPLENVYIPVEEGQEGWSDSDITLDK